MGQNNQPDLGGVPVGRADIFYDRLLRPIEPGIDQGNAVPV